MVAIKKDKINGDALGTGRRKSSIARVRVRAGSGAITINKKPIEEYFVNSQDRLAIAQTLAAADLTGKVDVLVRVNGGGLTGQSGAVRMGLARALVCYDEALHDPLRDGGFLTRRFTNERAKEAWSSGCSSRRPVQQTLTFGEFSNSRLFWRICSVG